MEFDILILFLFEFIKIFMFRSIRKIRVLSILLAALFFVNTAGICLDFHYCQGKFKTYKFYGEADSCHKKAERSGDFSVKVCHHKTELEKKSCCKNEMSSAKFAINYGDLNQTNKVSTPIHQPKIDNDILDIIINTPFSDCNLIYKFYKPPWPERKLNIRIQQFLC